MLKGEQHRSHALQFFEPWLGIFSLVLGGSIPQLSVEWSSLSASQCANAVYRVLHLIISVVLTAATTLPSMWRALPSRGSGLHPAREVPPSL